MSGGQQGPHFKGSNCWVAKNLRLECSATYWPRSEEDKKQEYGGLGDQDEGCKEGLPLGAPTSPLLKVIDLIIP